MFGISPAFVVYSYILVSVLDPKPTPAWIAFSIIHSVSFSRALYWKRYTCQMRSGDETRDILYWKCGEEFGNSSACCCTCLEYVYMYLTLTLTLPLTHTDTIILTCNVYFAHSSWEWPVLRTSDLLCVVAENWTRTDDYSTRSTLTNTGTSVPSVA